jgi:hypothetical protein
MAALEKVAEATDSTTLNLRSEFCTGGVCRTNIGNRWMYRDGLHISVEESKSLAPTFAKVLKGMIREYWGSPREGDVPRGAPVASPQPSPTP